MTNEMIVIDGESLTIEEIVSIKEFSTKVRIYELYQ